MLNKLKNIIGILLVIVIAVTCYIIAPEAANATWTGWIPESEAPSVYYEKSAPRTEYRSRTKTTTTSYATSMSGYTQNGYSLIDNGGGTIDYVSNFPSGFNTNHSLYSQYHKTPVSSSENSTSKTTVSTSTIGYIYWHWCRGDHVGAIDRFIELYYTDVYHDFHAYFRSSPLGMSKHTGVFQEVRTDICDSTFWWFAADPDRSAAQLEVKRCSYTNYKKLYNYYKWSSWSSWRTKPITIKDNVEVQTRTTRRYRITPYSSEKANPKLKVTKTKYSKTYGNKAFSLKVTRLGKGKITYSSNNKKVAKVSSKGKVTIKGCGKTTIKVKVKETTKYKGAKKKVTITVKPGKLKLKNFRGNKKALKIYYVKQNNADGYQCKYNRGNKTITTTSKKNYVVLKNLQNGNCIASVRAFKKIDGKKVYGKAGRYHLSIG